MDLIARGMAAKMPGLAAALAARGQSRIGPSVCGIGDSNTALANFNGHWRSAAYMSWVRALTGQRFDIQTGYLYATTGYTIAQILATHVPQAIAGGHDIGVLMGLTNDVSANTPYGDAVRDLGIAIDLMLAAGMRVILVPIPPRGSGGASWSTARRRLQQRINQWIRERALQGRGVYLADPTDAMIDFATGYALTGYMQSDALHHMTPGGYAVGLAVANVLNTLYPARPSLLVDVGDVYHAAENPTGNLIANGLMAGSVTTAQDADKFVNGATGTLPTSFFGRRSGAAITLTGAFAKEADPLFTGLERAVLTLGGTADGGSVELRQTINQADIAVGDVLVAECEVEWSGLANINSVQLYVQMFGGSNGTRIDMFGNAYDGPLIAASGKRLIYRTPPLTVVAGQTGGMVNVQVGAMPSGAAAGVVKVGRMSVRKLLPV